MRAPRRALLAAALAMAAGAACAPPPLAIPEPVVLRPEPAPAQVERILFLLGDPGASVTAHSPVLQRLTRDVEEWSTALPDSSVAVLVLGDIVYPLGMHGPESQWFDHDTAVVASQIRLVAGPEARRRGSRIVFIAGNHDWGLRDDYEGARRLARLAAFADSMSEADGLRAVLVPAPGTGGPFVWDWGPNLRILLLDTAWWLLGRDDPEEVPFFRRVDDAMASAGDRRIIFGAHHPLRTAGPHGGEFSIWKMFGLYYVAQRAGVLLQDMSSGPYRSLDRGLREIFERRGPPFAFIGGHEHSLQLFERVSPTDPDWGIVSGAGSKLTAVGGQEGLRFAADRPGYMRMIFLRDGSVHLSVEATDPEFVKCEDPATAADCVARGVAAFRIVHAQPLTESR